MHLHLAVLIVGCVIVACAAYANEQLNPYDLPKKLVRVLLVIAMCFVILTGFGLIGGPGLTVGW